MTQAEQATESPRQSVVKDSTADYSDEEMHAALDVNTPSYASAIVTTKEVVDAIPSLKSLGVSA